jgi:hypothetical protein
MTENGPALLYPAWLAARCVQLRHERRWGQHARYNISPKGQARRARYNATGKRRACDARYNVTSKGVFARARARLNESMRRHGARLEELLTMAEAAQ